MSQPRLPAVQRRRQLLDVSLEVFAQRGFHGASMAEVAEAAGVTKPVLYQHFKSKRDLYLELLDDVGQRLLEEVQKATAAASPISRGPASAASAPTPDSWVAQCRCDASAARSRRHRSSMTRSAIEGCSFRSGRKFHDESDSVRSGERATIVAVRGWPSM